MASLEITPLSEKQDLCRFELDPSEIPLFDPESEALLN